MESEKKRTQRDYTLAFKLSVVDQVEKGELSYIEAQARYGIQGRSATHRDAQDAVRTAQPPVRGGRERGSLTSPICQRKVHAAYQNALAERVNGILKNEFLLHRPADIEQARRMVSESVTIYNQQRPQ